MQNYNKLRLLSFAEGFPLNARLVFSSLAAISERGWLRSVNQLSQQLSLHHQTIKNTLVMLETHGLVARDGKKWKACEPPAGVLRTFKSSAPLHWSKQALYLSVELLQGQTVVASAIYSWLKNGNQIGRPSANGIAAILGVDRDTVIRSLDKLKAAGLIDKDWCVQDVATATATVHPAEACAVLIKVGHEASAWGYVNDFKQEKPACPSNGCIRSFTFTATE